MKQIQIYYHNGEYQAPKQRLMFKIHSRHCRQSSKKMQESCEVGEKVNDFTRSLSDYQTTYDMKNAREFRKACLQRSVRTDTNVCRCVELDII